jgi:hypothetical protein
MPRRQGEDGYAFFFRKLVERETLFVVPLTAIVIEKVL